MLQSFARALAGGLVQMLVPGGALQHMHVYLARVWRVAAYGLRGRLAHQHAARLMRRLTKDRPVMSCMPMHSV